jgi:hypothetical protein
MLLGGKSEDKEPKGPMAGFKKKWQKLEPKKQKTITLIIFALAIVVFAGLGYHSRQNRTHKIMKEHEPEAREISLNTDVIEKSLFRQAQDTINQQGKLIADMRKEIAKVKAATEEAARKNNSSPGRAGIAPPSPPGIRGEGRPEHQTQPEARSPAPRYYSPPPPPPPSSFAASNKKGQEENSLFGGITVIANASPPEEPKEEPKKKYRIYLSPKICKR